MSGDIKAESPVFRGRRNVCVHTVVRCWSTHNKCDTALGTCGGATGDVGRFLSRGSTSPLRGPGRRRREMSNSDLGVSWATQQDVKARCQQLVCRCAL